MVADSVEDLEPNQRGILNRLFQLNKRVFKAYLLKESLEGLWSYRYEGAMVNYLRKWIDRLRWQRLTSLLRAVGDGATLAGPPFTEFSLAFSSCPIVLERSSLSRVRFAAPNNGAPLTTPGRSEEKHIPDKRKRLI